MIERRRQTPAGDRQPQFGGGAQSGGDEFFVEPDAHAFAALGKEQRRFVATIAGLAEQQRLDADLDAFRQIGAFRHMRTFAGLDVDRHNHSVFGFEHVDFGGEPEFFGGEQQPPRFQDLVVAQSLRRR